MTDDRDFRRLLGLGNAQMSSCGNIWLIALRPNRTGAGQIGQLVRDVLAQAARTSMSVGAKEPGEQEATSIRPAPPRQTMAVPY